MYGKRDNSVKNQENAFWPHHPDMTDQNIF